MITTVAMTGRMTGKTVIPKTAMIAGPMINKVVGRMTRGIMINEIVHMTNRKIVKTAIAEINVKDRNPCKN
ncbi:MAG: hypothetical protein BGO07_04060 [Alphaproteobacteria bacterium 40-19]|nr:MAG: hypothetical protein BGO07_04060 [Alphaproteobacteria bacterium 40-19]